MRIYLLVLLLLVGIATAVEFSVNAPTQTIQGSMISANILMNNTQTVYGYEVTISVPATYTAHTFTNRVVGAINSFTSLNSTSSRAATVAATGIAAGEGSVVDINYTASQQGNITFIITAKAYDQNGSTMAVTTTDGQTSVQANEIRIISADTNQKTATINICTQSPAISQLNFTLAYDDSLAEVDSSTVPYTPTAQGVDVTLTNVAEQTTCQNVAQFTFNISADPGTSIPLTIQSIETDPTTPITEQNGTIDYNAYALTCTNVTAFRNTTAAMTLQLADYASLDQLAYELTSVFTINNITNSVGGISIVGDDVTHTQMTPQIASIDFIVPPAQANGTYAVSISDIIGEEGSENITHDDIECFVEVITNCFDNDGDGYYIGTECDANLTQDCDDNSAAVKPGATETCNSLDDDCDGSVDEGLSCGSGGSSGGGSSGGGSSASSSSSSAGGTGGFSPAPITWPVDESITAPEPKEQPIQTKAAPASTPEADAQGTKPGAKKVPLAAHLLGILVLLGAGVLVAYEYIKHRKPH